MKSFPRSEFPKEKLHPSAPSSLLPSLPLHQNPVLSSLRKLHPSAQVWAHILQSGAGENSGVWASSCSCGAPAAGHRILAVAGISSSFPDSKHGIANAPDIQPHSDPAACLSVLVGEMQPSGCRCHAESPPFWLGTIWTSSVCAGPDPGHHNTVLWRNISSAFSIPEPLAHRGLGETWAALQGALLKPQKGGPMPKHVQPAHAQLQAGLIKSHDVLLRCLSRRRGGWFPPAPLRHAQPWAASSASPALLIPARG